MTSGKTDWDAYYASPPGAAPVTRRITTACLVRMLRAAAPGGAAHGVEIAELGGANSCFRQAVCRALPVSRYHVLDNNPVGLERTRRTFGDDPALVIWDVDLLAGPPPGIQADIAFSVGLIEHFDAAGTARMIAAHFELLKPAGFAIVSYPTPTLLYRVTRALAEAAGLWIFHDERPLRQEETFPILLRHGTILQSRIIWPIFLTQQMVLVRKRPDLSPRRGEGAPSPPERPSATEAARDTRPG
jgi:hypothetical protein